MPLARTNRGRVGCTGVRFNDFDLSDVFEIRSVETSLLPTIEAVTMDVATMTGEYFVRRKIKTRIIHITLALDAQSRCPLDIFHAFRAYGCELATDEPKPLYLKSEAYVMAMVTGESPITVEAYKGVATLDFTCFDPYFYGETHEETLKSGANELYIHSPYPVWPIFEITGVNGTFTLTERGKMVRTGGLTSVSKLTIDMEHHCCFVGGSYKAADPSVSDFWAIPKGITNVNLSAGTGVMRYQERSL